MYAAYENVVGYVRKKFTAPKSLFHKTGRQHCGERAISQGDSVTYFIFLQRGLLVSGLFLAKNIFTPLLIQPKNMNQNGKYGARNE